MGMDGARLKPPEAGASRKAREGGRRKTRRTDQRDDEANTTPHTHTNLEELGVDLT
jgi:hypothetical protein